MAHETIKLLNKDKLEQKAKKKREYYLKLGMLLHQALTTYMENKDVRES